MKKLYITAVVTFSGKTSLALGIGLKLQAMGHKVGYIKPISTQPFFIEGKLADEDAVFVSRMLGLDSAPADLAPIVIDDTLFDAIVNDRVGGRDFRGEIKTAVDKAGQGKDVLLVEGGASMREGYAVGLSTVAMAEMLDLPTLGVVRYRDGLMLLDDLLAMQTRIGNKRLLGAVINSVPMDAMAEVKSRVVPYLEKHGLRIYGVLPHQQALMSISLDELIQTLRAKVLLKGTQGEALIENLSVGAMSAEAALPRFRRLLNKAVITGGDRADVQAAALETSTTALVLTGNLEPTATILKRAEEVGVAVMMVPTNTIETVEAVEKVFGKTRLAQPEKLNRFKELLDANLDFERLFKDLGL
ncbi:MAG TPA: phosphotransacetylase family protein [Aggregatilineales bacterium]|nr:phosphotransacetylase family protein [Aggregatilineales bacterium]